jgi:hypothetical protein
VCASPFAAAQWKRQNSKDLAFTKICSTPHPRLSVIALLQIAYGERLLDRERPDERD